eukprot:jgi/Mesvir1/969/Mv17521-RA.2
MLPGERPLPPIPRRPTVSAGSSPGARTRTHATGASNRHDLQSQVSSRRVSDSAARPVTARLDATNSPASKLATEKSAPLESPRTPLSARCISGREPDGGSFSPWGTQPTDRITREDHNIHRRIWERLFNYGGKATKIRRELRRQDVDKDGKLTREQLQKGLERFSFGLSDADLQGIVRVLDNDGSGTIDYSKFLEFYGANADTGEQLRAARIAHLGEGRDWDGRVKDNVMEAAPWERVHGAIYEAESPVRIPRESHSRADVQPSRMQEMAEFRRINKDGCLPVDAFVSALGQMNSGLTEGQLRHFASFLDRANTGKVNVADFVSCMEDERGLLTKASPRPEHRVPASALEWRSPKGEYLREKLNQSQQRARQVLRSFDSDQDGLLTREELNAGIRRLCPHIPEAEVDAMLQTMGEEGHVNLREFLNCSADLDAPSVPVGIAAMQSMQRPPTSHRHSRGGGGDDGGRPATIIDAWSGSRQHPAVGRFAYRPASSTRHLTEAAEGAPAFTDETSRFGSKEEVLAQQQSDRRQRESVLEARRRSINRQREGQLLLTAAAEEAAADTARRSTENHARQLRRYIESARMQQAFAETEQASVSALAPMNEPYKLRGPQNFFSRAFGV